MYGKILIGLQVLILSFFFSGPSFSAESAKPDSAPPIPFESGTLRTLPSKPGDLFSILPNGLTVLVSRRTQSDVVSAQVFVRAGSILEGNRMSAGLSHYLEHIVAGGSTRSFSEDEAITRLQKIGGESNAYTTYDRTVYYINTSARHWKDVLDLLLSYVSESLLDPNEVSREKSVIQQEIKMGENNPGGELWKMFVATAYQASPVRNPVIGFEEVFVNNTRDDLLSYYSDRYQPANIIVSVAGNITPSEVLEYVSAKTRNFARKAAKPSALPVEPSQITRRWAEREHPVTKLTQVILGFPSVSVDSDDLYALDVLSLLLGDGETSRLHNRLKERENRVLSVGSSNWTPAFIHGQFTVSLTLVPENWPGVLKDIEEEIDVFKRDLVSEKEIEKAKKTAIAQHVFGKETASAAASSLASSYFTTSDPYFEEAYVERIRQVTPDDIRSVARRYLLADRMNVAVLKPKGAQDATVEAKRPQGEAPAASTATFHRLENGLKALIERDASLPMVTIQLYGLGGVLLEDPKQSGVSSLTASLLTSGTKKRTRAQILQSIEDVGGVIDVRSDNSTYHVSIKVLKEDLDTALDILSDVARDTQFPEEEIEKKRKDTLLAIRRIDENWQMEVLRMFKKRYFDKSPYINDRLGTAESVQSLRRDDLVNFYHRMVNPNHSVIAVYGDIDPQTVLSGIRTRLADWKGPEVKSPDLPDETSPLKTNQVVEKKNEKSSAALFIGAAGRSVDDPKRPVLDVMDSILSGAGGTTGRLFDALRGREDLVYVVGAFPFYGKKAGFFGVITQTTMANLDRVQSIILDEIRRLAEKPVSIEELESAKGMLLTARRLQMESLESRAQSAAINEVLGLGWKYDEEYVKSVQTVTPEEIQATAKQLFSHTLIARTIPERPVEALAAPPVKSDVRTP